MTPPSAQRAALEALIAALPSLAEARAEAATLIAEHRGPTWRA